MTIKKLKEILSRYDEDTNILFWELERGYLEFQFIDDDPLFYTNEKRIDIVVKQTESE